MWTQDNSALVQLTNNMNHIYEWSGLIKYILIIGFGICEVEHRSLGRISDFTISSLVLFTQLHQIVCINTHTGWYDSVKSWYLDCFISLCKRNHNEPELGDSLPSSMLLEIWSMKLCHWYMWPWTTKPVIRVHLGNWIGLNDISIDVWFGQYLENLWACKTI